LARRTCVLALAAVYLLPASAQAAFGDRPLRKGTRGHDVRVLQSWLTHLGHPTAVDGVFGRDTRRSVRRYERAEGLRVNGRVSRREARGLRREVEAPAEPPVAAATLSPDGRTAIAPEGAPPQVQAAVAAANRITDKPYRYGGGHGRVRDSGYDCSGAVSYVLHGAGLLRRARDSRGLMSWRRRGPGRWITVYANRGHAYVVLAGLRFDTSGRGESGPRWRPAARSPRRYVARHAWGL
jgi:cell wall-associated NlpC family hydrolase